MTDTDTDTDDPERYRRIVCRACGNTPIMALSYDTETNEVVFTYACNCTKRPTGVSQEMDHMPEQWQFTE
jgi:hypothetical protein